MLYFTFWKVKLIAVFLLLIQNNVYSLLLDQITSKANNSISIINKTISETTNLNCFGIPNNIFTNALKDLITQKTKENDVRFYFYSRDKPKNTTIKSTDDFNLENIKYSPNRTTVVIVHGFMSSGKEDWVLEMKDEFLKLENVNVIVVDWQKGSNTWNYYAASVNTQIVGGAIAKLMSKIKIKVLKASPSISSVGSIHFVGHSLGAHICARSAYLIKEVEKNETANWILKRISALDPAQPCFKQGNVTLKLNKNDAQYIDVIHTNANNLLLLGLGLSEQLGNADYYPNGGKVQLGCQKINTSIWSFLLLPVNLVKEAICSHGRSHQLFTDTLKVKLSGKCRFIGHPWDKKYENLDKLLKTTCDTGVCPEMGINSINYHPKQDGTFFVPTAETENYCDVSEKDLAAIKKQLKRDQITSKIP